MDTQPILVEVPEELHGERIVVRPYRREDAVALWDAVQESREHLAPWLPWVQGYRSLDDARAYVARAHARWELREDMAYGIFAREDGRLLGGTGLHDIDWSLRTFEIGYWIRRTAVGRGYVSEAVQALTRLAFEQLGANRVQIRIQPRNERSRCVAEGLGFLLEGTLRRSAPGVDGTARDMHVYALIPEDYHNLPWVGRQAHDAQVEGG